MLYDYILTVKVKADDPACFEGLLRKLLEELDSEVSDGKICHADGDFVEWESTIEESRAKR